MVLAIPSAQAGSCRTYRLPVCESNQSVSTSTVPPAAVFQIRQRDVLDYTVDATAFLAALGDSAEIASATVTLVSTVTQAGAAAPAGTITGSGYDPAGTVRFVFDPAALSAVGDIATVDVSFTTTATRIGTTTLPGRTITRRLLLVTVPG